MVAFTAMSVMMFVATLAPQTQAHECVDPHSCVAVTDHSLLQAKIHVHSAHVTRVQDSRDCPEFGRCEEESDAVNKARLSALVEEAKHRKKLGSTVEPTKIAWDCGSSGSNMMVLSVSTTCGKAMQNDDARILQQLTGFPEGNKGVAVKNPDASELSKAKVDDCTVSKAFGGPTGRPVGKCEFLWSELAKWTKTGERASCFGKAGLGFDGSVCWAAGTAGNRLQPKLVDQTGWKNFEAWTQEQGICGSWATAVYPSYEGTLTIPGTVEAAMEVETLIGTLGLGKAKAFGSAGGSSAQFGVCLSCATDPAAASQGWQALLTKWNVPFKNANFLSEVDSSPADYLNTYETKPDTACTNTQNPLGGVCTETWGVGSFLGTDNCAIAATTSPVTPMGGISAMGCGLDLALKTLYPGKTANTATSAELIAAMKSTEQGKFASDFAQFVQEYFFGAINTIGDVRFVAKIYSLQGGHTLKYDSEQNAWVHDEHKKNFVTGKELGGQVFNLANRINPDAGDEYDSMVAKSYAYMKTLGLLPAYPDLRANDRLKAEQNFLEDTMKDDGGEDYAWLRKAAGIGFSQMPGKFKVNPTNVR